MWAFKIRHMQARSLDMKIIQLAPWPGFDTIHDKTSYRSMGEGSYEHCITQLTQLV